MRVLIFGTFDHLHPGHKFVITEAMKKGDVSIVVARDRNVLHIKGASPDQTEEKRLTTLKEAFPDVTVMLGDPEDFLVPVRSVKPDLILLGYDQKLPPGVSEADFPCPLQRLAAFKPTEFKSSLRRRRGRSVSEHSALY